MFYSKSTNGFYRAEIHGTKMPVDVVEITDVQWQALLTAQAQGKVIGADAQGRPLAQDPAPVPPFAPKTVSAFQAKGALLQDGSLTAVEAIMVAPTTPALLKLAWREALYFERDSPGILWLAAQLSWTSARLDALFITAFGIKA